MAAMTWIWCVHLFFIIYMNVYKLDFSCNCEISGFFRRGFLETSSFFIQRGNGGLTYEESKSHFTAWALMKSPLLVRCLLSIFFRSLSIHQIGTDVRILASTTDILTFPKAFNYYPRYSRDPYQPRDIGD